jgi:drug/metabolite transporter (DMT)-like permease
MKISNIILLTLFSFGMALGQISFKYAALRQVETVGDSRLIKFISLISDWPFLFGVFVYFILLFYWLWLMTFIPLSRAYPYTLLSVIITSFLAPIFFNESIGQNMLLGFLFIAIGLFFISYEY